LVARPFPLTADFERAAKRNPAEMFSPDVPLTWRYGVLRLADGCDSYRLLRLREWWPRFWHGLLKMPVVSSDEKQREFLDYRGESGSYQRARSHCKGRNWFVVAMPFEQEPLGDELFANPTFIRPLNEPDRDEHFASVYTQTLADFICADLSRRNRELTRELEAVRFALEEDYE
jgi:hypothetical protein